MRFRDRPISKNAQIHAFKESLIQAPIQLDNGDHAEAARLLGNGDSYVRRRSRRLNIKLQ